MSNIRTCKVLIKSNEENGSEEELTIFTEWNDLKIKLLIIRSDKTLLTGEIPLEDFNKYAKTFDKTLEVYLDETQNILSGDDADIEFLLKDYKFSWKRKRWCLGQILVAPTTEADCLTNFILHLLDDRSKTRKITLELEKEHATLKKNYSKLQEKVNEMIKLKNDMESTLYQRFMLILNTKKAKIRELKCKIEKLEARKDPIFDATTDESDNDNDSKSKLSDLSSQTSKLNIQKRKITSEPDKEKIGNNKLKQKRKFLGNEKIENNVNETVINIKDNFEKLKTNNEVVNKNLSKRIQTSKNLEPIASTSKDLSKPTLDKFVNDSNLNTFASKHQFEKIETLTKDIQAIPSTSKGLNMYTDTFQASTELNTIEKTTSLNCDIGEDDETPDLFENESNKSDGNESECEVELKLEEEKVDEKIEIRESAITEDDSEEEMF